MGSVEASLRIRVHDFWAWYPPVEEGQQSLPLFASTLAAAHKNVMPQSDDALSKSAQLSIVSGHRMVLVVAIDDLPKPFTDFARAIMHPAPKLELDSLELRDHPRLRRNAPDGKGPGLVASPTHVSEAQEGERLWFSRATQLPISGSITPELDQSSLLRMEFQAELRQPFLEVLQESNSIGLMLEARHKIVGIAHDEDRASPAAATRITDTERIERRKKLTVAFERLSQSVG